jgi:hypothetical protein
MLPLLSSSLSLPGPGSPISNRRDLAHLPIDTTPGSPVSDGRNLAHLSEDKGFPGGGGDGHDTVHPDNVEHDVT